MHCGVDGKADYLLNANVKHTKYLRLYVLSDCCLGPEDADRILLCNDSLGEDAMFNEEG